MKYIHNEGKGKWADDPNVDIEYLGTLGEIEDSDENYMFYIPIGIAADREGNLYVLDSGNCRIQKYNRDLKYIHTIGNKGQGPSELMLPTDIEVDLNGNVTVFDNGNRRFVTFSPEGDYISSIRKNESTFSFRHLSTGEIIVWNPGIEGYRSYNGPVPLFFVMDSKLKQKRTIGKSIYYGDMHKKYSGMNRFNYTVDKQDNIYVAYRSQNRIEKYSKDGQLIFVADRPVSKKLKSNPPPPFSAAGTMGIDVDSNGRIWTLSIRKRIKRGTGAVLGGITHEDRSSSYVIRGNTEVTETDSFCLELFDSDGTLLKTFVLSHFVTNLRILNDKIYILEQLRGMQFHIYDININK
ncbi:MAG: 6-bladed beta-propeller [bacterium]|nr:6-bladed beta-propeller [bacterium]